MDLPPTKKPTFYFFDIFLHIIGVGFFVGLKEGSWTPKHIDGPLLFGSVWFHIFALYYEIIGVVEPPPAKYPNFSNPPHLGLNIAILEKKFYSKEEFKQKIWYCKIMRISLVITFPS